MVDRHSFHLENVGGQDLTTVLMAVGYGLGGILALGSKIMEQAY